MKKILVAFVALILPTGAFATGGVVSSANPQASAAGQEILRAGGSSTDAAMAMMLALTVVEPQSSGIGGGGFFVHHDGRTGMIETVDGREKAPAAARPDRFLGTDGKPRPYIQAFPGGQSVGVPGNIRLMAMVHARWGKLPWSALFAPAIRLAEGGFPVTRAMNGSIPQLSSLWKDYPAIAKLYLDRNGEPFAPGTTIRNPALAETLRTVAKGGADAFYSGKVADQIIAAATGSRVRPSDITHADLMAYQAKRRAPVCGTYRSYRICGMGPPSSGGITVLQILGMLQRFDMAKLGKNSPVAWHLIGEAMQLAYADRDKYLGDRDFVSVPVGGLIDPAYLAQRSRAISTTASLPRYTAGTPAGSAPRTAAASSEVPATTHFTAVDGDGSVVSMTSTIEGPYGSQLVAGGMMLNNELTDFTFAPEKDGAPVANRVEGNKRPLSSMSPTIVYDASGKPVLALGSAGGKRIIMHVTKTLIGVLDFGLPVDQAIALPNIFFTPEALVIENNAAGTALAPQIAKLGQPAQAVDLGSKVNAVARGASGWTGFADPRSEGIALTE